MADKLMEMKCLNEERDMVGSVQGGAVGVLKNLAKGNRMCFFFSCSHMYHSFVNVVNLKKTVANSIRIILPSSESSIKPPLPVLLAYNKRTNDFALKAESSRVLVNVVRTLFSNQSVSPSDEDRVQEAKAVLLEHRQEVSAALVGLLRGGIGGKYEVLCIEAVVALALFAGGSLKNGSYLSSFFFFFLGCFKIPKANTLTDLHTHSSRNHRQQTIGTRLSRNKFAKC